MTAMVTLWNRALSEQWWRWDRNEWADTYAAMPEDLADTELVQRSNAAERAMYRCENAATYRHTLQAARHAWWLSRRPAR